VTPRNLNRLKLLGIAALAVLPVAGSYLLYWFWSPHNQVNYGMLVEPRALPEAGLTLVDGSAFSFRQLRGRWVLLTVDAGDCDKGCRDKLWKMRQVRLTQGKDANRIERAWLVDDATEPAPAVLSEYDGTWAIRARSSPVLAALPAAGDARAHIYLVDPQGYVMLKFPPDADPRAMMKDIGRLLRYARTG